MTCDRRGEGRVSFVNEVTHMVYPPLGVFHLLHSFLHLVHFSLQVWHPLSDGTSRLISSFDAILGPFIP